MESSFFLEKKVEVQHLVCFNESWHALNIFSTDQFYFHKKKRRFSLLLSIAGIREKIHSSLKSAMHKEIIATFGM